jgi:hypothetical protein
LKAFQPARQLIRNVRLGGRQQFKIDDTDFGIDAVKSRFEVRILKSGDALIDAEVYGNENRYEEVTQDYDSSPWSWTLYPPHFYMRSYPAESDRSSGTFKATVSTADLDEYEVAIYLMEHNDVDGVKVTADRQTFKATGVVYLSGKPHPFSISFTKQ